MAAPVNSPLTETHNSLVEYQQSHPFSFLTLETVKGCLSHLYIVEKIDKTLSAVNLTFRFSVRKKDSNEFIKVEELPQAFNQYIKAIEMGNGITIVTMYGPLHEICFCMKKAFDDNAEGRTNEALRLMLEGKL